MEAALDARIERATMGDKTTAETLAKPRGGLGGASIKAMNLNFDDLERVRYSFDIILSFFNPLKIYISYQNNHY